MSFRRDWTLCVALAIRVLRGFEMPLDQLPELDASARHPIGAVPNSSAVSPEDAIEQARWQVRGPAIGLLVTGVLNAVATLVVGMLIAWYVLWGVRPMPDLPVVLAFPFVPSLAFTVVIIAAALKMRRLDGYGWAVFGSILAVISGNLIGLVTGIWALVVLSDPTVKKAFEEQTRLRFGGDPPQPTAWHRRFGGVALAIFLLAVPLSLLAAVFLQTAWQAAFLHGNHPRVGGNSFGTCGLEEQVGQNGSDRSRLSPSSRS